jgi:hypothetical protein
MGVVDQAVQDGVGDCRIGEVVVPVFDRDLARDDGRAGGVAVFENFEDVAPLLLAQWCEPPVVEHEDVDLRETPEQAGVRAVGMGQSEFLEESRDSAVQGTTTDAAGLLSESAGQVGLAGAGGTGDHDIGVSRDPLASSERSQLRAIDVALRRHFEIFEASIREPQLGLTQ